LRFTPDGKRLISGGGEPSRSGELKVWQVSDGQLLQEFNNIHSDVVFGIDLTPDGKYLASSAADKFIRVIDFTTGKIIRSLEGHTHHVLSVSWKRDGHC
jgi:WD40 repeat protein